MNSLYFILLVAGFSFVQWLFKHLAAQAEKRRLQQAQQRHDLEMLRTGRNTEDSEPAAPIDSQARRREELAELRRRAAARRGPRTEAQPPRSSGGSNTATPLEILLGLPPGATTGGTVSPSRARAPRPEKLRAAQQQSQGQFQEQEQSDREEKRRRQAQRLRAEKAAADLRRKQEQFELRAQTARAAQAKEFEQRLLRDSKAISARGPLGTIGVVPRNAAEWRRAIAMNEVLGKPVSMR
ncbi:MAG: hypothetical protein KF805_07010 [Phycisphaeraceae bacterium]|nr:hypothetical protein [Phycisphaeraceae bacterium]